MNIKKTAELALEQGNGEAIFTDHRFVSSLRAAAGAESDWTHHGR